MKNVFKKAVSLTVALSTVAALSVSAFAAGTATYYPEATTVDDVAIAADTVVVKDYTVVADATQYAVAVVPFGFTGDDDDADASIYYVNQADSATIESILENMLVKGDLPDGEYEVRIGNNGSSTGYEQILFTVSSTPAGVQITLNYGDVNGDTAVGAADASLILQKGVGLIAGFTDQENRQIPETVGDVNGDTAVGAADASLILQKGVGLITGFTDQNGDALTTYTYTYVAPTE